MLQAVNVLTGALVLSTEATARDKYLCPECHGPVGLRVGRVKVPHFAHFARSLCSLAEPESPRHRALKWLCKQLFHPLPVAWEVLLGQRRVDVLVADQFAVECQTSPLSTLEWSERTAHHNRHGFPVLWLWDVKRLCGKNTLAEAQTLANSQRSIWAPKEIRVCHEESGGVIYVADKRGVLPCRLTAAPRKKDRSLPAHLPADAVQTLTFLQAALAQAWVSTTSRSQLVLLHLSRSGA